MKEVDKRPKQNKRNSILMVCSECGCLTIAKREDYEKKGKLKKAIWLYDVCAWCQEPGNFYDDCQYYYDDKGEINDL